MMQMPFNRKSTVSKFKEPESPEPKSSARQDTFKLIQPKPLVVLEAPKQVLPVVTETKETKTIVKEQSII